MMVEVGIGVSPAGTGAFPTTTFSCRIDVDQSQSGSCGGTGIGASQVPERNCFDMVDLAVRKF